MSKLYKNSARFGKRMELELMSRMLLEGLDVYTPLVDDHGVDCVVKRASGTFIEIQIKARSSGVAHGQGAFFPEISHEPADNFYFVFYSERLKSMWIMSSEEFMSESYSNKTGKNKGTHSINFAGKRTNKATGEKEEFPKEIFNKYLCGDFSKFH